MARMRWILNRRHGIECTYAGLDQLNHSSRLAGPFAMSYHIAESQTSRHGRDVEGVGQYWTPFAHSVAMDKSFQIMSFKF